VVKKNLWYWLAIPFLFLNGFFVAKMNDYPELAQWADRPEIAVISSVFVLVFALPSFVALVRWLEWRGVMALVALGVFAIAIESFAVATGYPYGSFVYGAKIGGKVFGLVPWTVPFAWTPILLGSYALARRTARGFWPVILATALWSVAFDLVLDPGAVSQGFWTYAQPGVYYDVPWSNFAGWLLSGTIGALILSRFTRWHGRDLPPQGLLGSAWLILLFWTSVCAWGELWVAAGFGVVLLPIVARTLLQRPHENLCNSAILLQT
jgi:putative membrane protein